MKKRSLKSSLVIGGLLAAVVPLAVVGLISLKIFSDKMKESAERRTFLLAQTMASMTEIAMEDELTLAKELADNEAYTTLLLDISQNGMSSVTDSLEQTDAIVHRATQLAGDRYESVFIADIAGLVVVDSSGGTIRKASINLSDRDYFQAAKNGQINIGTPVKSKASGNPIVVVAIPLKDQNQKVIGVFGAVVNLDGLSEKITKTRVGKTGYPFMVDKTGLLIAHPDPEQIFALNITTTKGMEDISEQMRSQKSGVMEYTIEGVNKIAGFVSIPLTGWSIAFT